MATTADFSGKLHVSLIKEARECAKKLAAGHWFLNRIPDIYVERDLPASVVENAIEEIGASDRDFRGAYEDKTRRIVVSEKLYPISTLKSVEELAQVIVDAACGECTFCQGNLRD
jgi:hypothetical protein